MQVLRKVGSNKPLHKPFQIRHASPLRSELLTAASLSFMNTHLEPIMKHRMPVEAQPAILYFFVLMCSLYCGDDGDLTVTNPQGYLYPATIGALWEETDHSLIPL